MSGSVLRNALDGLKGTVAVVTGGGRGLRGGRGRRRHCRAQSGDA